MEKKELKYNYVIIGFGSYYSVGYRDIMGLPNVSYHTSYYTGFNNPLSRLLVRLNFSRVVNKFLKYPFSKFVYPRLYPHRFLDEKPICFFFFGLAYYVYESTYIEYIKKHYPNCRIAIFMQDVVETKPYINMRKAIEVADLLLSYDLGDSKKYNMVFHPTPMSYVDVPLDESIEESDVYYCGTAKTRYPVVHEMYEKLKSLGLRCDFNLMNMPSDAPRVDGINYPDHFFEYDENLKHIIRTKCILEIQQENADGFTPRLWESITYNKHLITNNELVLSSPYYYSDGIHSIDAVMNGNIKEIVKEKVDYPSQIKESLSPLHLLYFIDSRL